MTTVKVIHVIAGLKKVGGAELMLKRLIETQNGGSEFEHSIISLSDLGEFGQGLIEAGISVDVLGMTSMRDMPRVLLRLIWIFRERRPDIVQTWMYHSDLLGGLAARMAGIGGIIWGVRTTDLQEGGKSTTVLVRKVCAWLSGFLPKYIVCAAEASRRSHIAVGYNASRMLVIPNGFDLTRLQAWHRGQRYRDWQSRQIPPGKGSCFLCRSCRSAGSTLFALEVSFGGTGAAVFQC